ncbi:MAG: carboxypeptidase regulatory-like domain-containing protein [Vicinamibacterales bacterium]
MRRWTMGGLALLVVVAFTVPAFAQGGGASSTGTIQGRVSDAQGAVLPGVTVTAVSTSLLGNQTTVTSETGNYRFPAVPPGTYSLTYELAGFNSVKREGISITLGFTAQVNVELALATLQETVTVTGASPVIDTSATRIQQNFKLDQLQSIPNGRDMWALLAVTPSVQMGRIDVGGNRAGTQTGYTAYGFNGQVRVLIEGINTTEGTGGAGFYFDYASLEEAFIGTSGQSAEMPNPGVQSQFIARSGGNKFAGEYHLDWYNNALQGTNIPDSYTAPTAFNNSPIRAHSNEISGYYDTDINVGGPLKKDKLWWFFTYRTQKNQVAQPNFTFDKTFDTKLWNPVTKWTYQVNQKNKFIGYYQWGQKEQPNRLPFSTYTYTDPGQTYKQDSGSWVYKAEWNGTISDKLYLEARYGDFGYYFPLIANTDQQYEWRDTGLAIVTGANQIWQLDRDRKQYNGAATYFLDTGKGSHTFKMGGELLKEASWEGYLQQWGGNIDHIYSNGVSSQVVFALPTATDAGKLSAHDKLTSLANLDQLGLFVNDTWAFGRATLNAGVRYDRYKGWLPEQQQLAASTGPVSVQAKTFPETTFYTWNQVAPRIGFIFDLTGDGKTIFKANYGLFWHNPGVGVGSSGNPNTADKRATYQWNDLNGDKKWQPGEEGTLQSASLEGAIQVDKAIKDPYTHETSVWVERQITDTMGVRAGFVYKTEDDLISTYQPGRGLDAYKTAGVPFTFVDIGSDGVRGTSDDKSVNMVGLPSANSATVFPATQVVMNLPQFGRYKTYEASLNKRYGNKWSGSMGYGFTQQHNFPNNYPQNPNQPGVDDRTLWNLKLSGSYDGPGGVRISPVLRHQSGSNFARTGTIVAPSGLFVTGTTFYVEPMDSNREDNIWVFDTRFEKTLSLAGSVRIRGMFDMFNITNSHASETISRATGLGYLKPSAILAPFTMRLGFRFIW